jgi:cytochrome c
MRPIAAALLIATLAAPALAQAPLKPLPPGMGAPPADPLAGADPAAGERVWRTCRACHAIEPGRHGVGPSLHGIVGARVAAQDWGRPYSSALAGIGRDGAVWDAATLSAYLENPRAFAPGTMMAFAGIRDPADRLNLIAWLAAQGN